MSVDYCSVVGEIERIMDIFILLYFDAVDVCLGLSALMIFQLTWIQIQNVDWLLSITLSLSTVTYLPIAFLFEGPWSMIIPVFVFYRDMSFIRFELAKQRPLYQRC